MGKIDGRLAINSYLSRSKKGFPAWSAALDNGTTWGYYCPVLTEALPLCPSYLKAAVPENRPSQRGSPGRNVAVRGFGAFMIRSLALAVAIVIGLLAAGCSSPALFQQPAAPTPPALLQRASADSAPDVRIISLDFVPPIKDDGTCDDLANRTLLVVVDNRGALSENGVEVKLEVSGQSDGDTLVSQSQTIPVLSSGEAKVLKFSNFLPPQNRPTYNLKVDVKPVQGERNVDDNHKTLVLRVTKS
jgi:hypothetical protein